MKWRQLPYKMLWEREDGAQLSAIEINKFAYKRPDDSSMDAWLNYVWRLSHGTDEPVPKPTPMRMLPIHYFAVDDFVKISRGEIHPAGGQIDNLTGRYGRVVDMDNKFLFLQLGESELITSAIMAGRCDVCTPDGEVIELCPEELRIRVKSK